MATQLVVCGAHSCGALQNPEAGGCVQGRRQLQVHDQGATGAPAAQCTRARTGFIQGALIPAGLLRTAVNPLLLLRQGRGGLPLLVLLLGQGLGPLP